jgi:hypothetical protein
LFGVIGSVKPRAFKYYTGAAADEALDLAPALGAFLQRFVIHALKGIKMMAAL